MKAYQRKEIAEAGFWCHASSCYYDSWVNPQIKKLKYYLNYITFAVSLEFFL
ncbi:MAG: hypothetical protein KI793_33550 [Rivularia sp. (in: Bacteria)]|nr:hypothetical protein [Rivularia sp. MS3]